MTGSRPKQNARMGMFYLVEAVLDVLVEAKHGDVCLGAAEISKRAGIFRKPGDKNQGEPSSMNDTITTGLLLKLMKENRVRRCKQNGGKGGWELTDEEYAERRDDIA